tara:strand:+ start:1041 stop:1904 length:864 start_codon:yes stop_codon:yes gene_type:complete
MIKNIVVGSGAQDITLFLGALDELINSEHIKLENIESLYGTSAGAVILFALAVKTDWKTFMEYSVKRPWNRVTDNATKALFNIFNNKGILDISILYDYYTPMLKTAGLKKNITFKELYEYSKIEYNIYAFNLNTFKGECFNHINTPDLEVIKGIYMSCTLPIVLRPLYYNGSYYLDGGMVWDCPIDRCLLEKKYDETICIRKLCKVRPLKNTLGEDSTLFEYLLMIINKMISYRRDMDDLSFKNTIVVYGKEAWHELFRVFSDEKKRNEKVEEGKELARQYLLKKQH